jgi:hypothetical protein
MEKSYILQNENNKNFCGDKTNHFTEAESCELKPLTAYAFANWLLQKCG